MAKHKTKSPLWQRIVIAVSCIIVAICVLIGVSAIFRRAVIRQGIQHGGQQYYSIIYVTEDDVLLLADTVSKNQKIKVASTPSKENYIFLGWNDGQKTYTTQELYNYTPSADTTFKPVFKGEEYTLKIYDIDMNLVETRTVEFGKPIGDLPEVPEREGYYSYYRDISTDNIQYSNAGIWNYGGDLEIKPVYSPLKWQVEYHINGEDISNPNPSYYVINGAKFNISDLQYYMFTYGTTMTLPNKDYLESLGNIVVSRAINTGNGVIEANYTTTVSELLNAKTLNGWLFNGQRTNGTFTYNEIKDLNHIDLYADLSDITYTATFIYEEQTYAVEQTYGEPIEFPAELPETTGIRKWSYTTENGTSYLNETDEVKYNFNSNITFTFVELLERKVVFNYNNADIGIEDEIIYLINSLKLPVPGRYGYSFAGWQDTETGRVYKDYINYYGPDSGYYDNPSMNNFGQRNTINVIATWNSEPDVNVEIIVVKGNQQINIGNTFVCCRGLPYWEYLPTPPEYEGYTFKKWVSSYNTTNPEDITSSYICSDYSTDNYSVKVYAVYEAV